MKIFVVRHGQTDWNKKRKLQGCSDIPLNEIGRKMAKDVALALQKIPFIVAFTSPLVRASETAKIILEGRSVPLFEDSRLREMEFGEYEGWRCEEGNCDLPADFFHFFNAPDKYVPPKGGESYEIVHKRIHSFLAELYVNQKYKDASVLITAHGAVLNLILHDVEKTPWKDLGRRGLLKNGSVTEIDVENGVPCVKSIGDIAEKNREL